MDQSAIHKIIKAEPPRKITVNELAAFADILEVPVESLLQPLETALSAKANALLDELHSSRTALMKASGAASKVVREIGVFLGSAQQLDSQVIDAMVKQDTAMVNLIDVLIEAEAALRGDDVADYPDWLEDTD